MAVKKNLFTNILIQAEKNKKFSCFIMGIVSDFVVMLYSYLVNHDQILLQAPLCFIIPFIGYINLKWFVEGDKNMKIQITLWTAVGNTIGTTLMLLFVKHLIN